MWEQASLHTKKNTIPKLQINPSICKPKKEQKSPYKPNKTIKERMTNIKYQRRRIIWIIYVQEISPLGMHLLQNRYCFNGNTRNHLDRHPGIKKIYIKISNSMHKMVMQWWDKESIVNYSRMRVIIPNIPQARSQHIHNLQAKTSSGIQKKKKKKQTHTHTHTCGPS